MNSRVHIIITGKVQGVCFRITTKQEAEKYDVKGWVRNKNDGSVEAVFEGEKNRVDSVLEWCGNGPLMANVKKVETKWEKHKNEFHTFQVRNVDEITSPSRRTDLGQVCSI
ncbi:MAG: acylphosphatase [Deltaproteobacteria bacterium]|nr:acylphosphatase [Deltaproteobacteria bacterium]